MHQLVPAQPPSHHSHLPRRTSERVGDAADPRTKVRVTIFSTGSRPRLRYRSPRAPRLTARDAAPVSAPLGPADTARAHEAQPGLRQDRTAEAKTMPPAGALRLRDGPGPAGACAFVVGGVRVLPSRLPSTRASRAVAAQGVKVVRTVARSTWTPGTTPAPLTCGPTAHGMGAGDAGGCCKDVGQPCVRSSGRCWVELDPRTVLACCSLRDLCHHHQHVLRSDEATQEGQGDRYEVDDQVQWPDGGRCVSAGRSCQEPRRYRRIGLSPAARARRVPNRAGTHGETQWSAAPKRAATIRTFPQVSWHTLGEIARDS
ncbi:hypothetical protein SAMN05216259_12021 [Actinacidiphila guanduensis]|uniref:Uncharacterized protein n=1 Tax=Actinacidiphila guanduensis TaxID=310781 RepID=A0A1H0QWE6_9ACTN|nr:hypothetical protein SAMN05216259_12021 [Actinacidiphila guanduensis]